jgi:hypothetical protein
VTRKIVFVGNCQIGMLADVYRRLVATETGDEVSYVPAYENATQKQRCLIATADVLVRQVLEFVPRIGELDTGATIHSVPNVTAAFLWPHAGSAHPRNAPAPLLDASGPYPGEIGDSFLNRMLAQNTPADAAVARYLDMDVPRVRNVDRLMELILDRQRARDEACGFNFADYIAANFRKQRLFLTPHHPATRMAIVLAAEVFGRIGVDTRIINAMQANPPSGLLPATEAPLHPSVIAHFGLREVTAETRYRYYNEGSFSFAEYAFRYMNFTWNPALAEGLHLYRINRTDEAVGVLERALKLSPRSALGHFVLAELMLRKGQFRQAIELAFKATLLEPQNAHFQARLDYLLSQQTA